MNAPPGYVSFDTPPAEVAQQLGVDVRTGLTEEALARKRATEDVNVARPCPAPPPRKDKPLLEKVVLLEHFLLLVAVACAAATSLVCAVMLLVLELFRVATLHHMGLLPEHVPLLAEWLYSTFPSLSGGRIFDRGEVIYSEGSTTVVRSGTLCQVPVSDLFVGDIALVQEGEEVPADMLVIESCDIRLDMSHLTADPRPWKKSAYLEPSPSPFTSSTLLIGGSLIRKGWARALVIATGDNTLSAMLLELRTRLLQRANKLKFPYDVITWFMGLKHRNTLRPEILFASAMAFALLGTSLCLIFGLDILAIVLVSIYTISVVGLSPESQHVYLRYQIHLQEQGVADHSAIVMDRGVTRGGSEFFRLGRVNTVVLRREDLLQKTTPYAVVLGTNCLPLAHGEPQALLADHNELLKYVVHALSITSDNGPRKDKKKQKGRRKFLSGRKTAGRLENEDEDQVALMDLKSADRTLSNATSAPPPPSNKAPSSPIQSVTDTAGAADAGLYSVTADGGLRPAFGHAKDKPSVATPLLENGPHEQEGSNLIIVGQDRQVRYRSRQVRRQDRAFEQFVGQVSAPPASAIPSREHRRLRTGTRSVSGLSANGRPGPLPEMVREIRDFNRRMWHLPSSGQIDCDFCVHSVIAGGALGLEEQLILWVRGSPEAVLERCMYEMNQDGSIDDLTPDRRKVLHRASIVAMDVWSLAFCKLRERGITSFPTERSPALVHRVTHVPLVFLGHVAMRATVHPEAPLSLASCAERNLKVVLATTVAAVRAERFVHQEFFGGEIDEGGGVGLGEEEEEEVEDSEGREEGKSPTDARHSLRVGRASTPCTGDNKNSIMVVLNMKDEGTSPVHWADVRIAPVVLCAGTRRIGKLVRQLQVCEARVAVIVDDFDRRDNQLAVKHAHVSATLTDIRKVPCAPTLKWWQDTRSKDTVEAPLGVGRVDGLGGDEEEGQISMLPSDTDAAGGGEDSKGDAGGAADHQPARRTASAAHKLDVTMATGATDSALRRRPTMHIAMDLTADMEEDELPHRMGLLGRERPMPFPDDIGVADLGDPLRPLLAGIRASQEFFVAEPAGGRRTPARAKPAGQMV